MLSRTSVVALLLDGPQTLRELADLLGLPVTALALRLDAMGIAACDHCDRRFLRKKGTAGRLCSRECYRGDPVRPAGLAAEPPALVIPLEHGEYSVVWHGGMWR